MQIYNSFWKGNMNNIQISITTATLPEVEGWGGVEEMDERGQRVKENIC